METVSLARVRELFDVDVEAGTMRWKVNKGRGRVGALAGKVHGQSGYLTVGIDNRHYRAHRLIWLCATGRWPANWLDHINGDRLDNRIDNLREVTPALNGRNRVSPQANSTTKLVGVSWHKLRQKWRASIQVDGKHIHLGLYDDPAIASAVYWDAKRRHHGLNAYEGRLHEIGVL